MYNIVGVEPDLLDWKDDTWKNLKITSLQHFDDAGVVALGESTFNGIHGNLTRRTLLGLMVLAYNLRDVDGDLLIDAIGGGIVNATAFINVGDLSDEVIAIGPRKDMTPIYDDHVHAHHRTARTAKAYCYLAASYLRLFTKSPEYYIKIGDHLRNRFENFYAFPLPFEEFLPSSVVVNAIRKQFDLDDRLKKTLYAIIFHSKRSNNKGSQLNNFLFQIHLNFTGMHALSLLTRILATTGLDTYQVLKSIYIPAFRKQIEAITSVGRMIGGGDGYRREMWKCARVFDYKFLAPLQTKNCVLFCLTLAYMVYEYGGESDSGVLNIAHINNAGMSEKKLAYALAKFGMMRLNKLRSGEGMQTLGAAHM